MINQIFIEPLRSNEDGKNIKNKLRFTLKSQNDLS